MGGLTLWITSRIPRSIRYIFAGGIGFVTAIVVLAFLVEVLNIWYLTASLITFVVATFVSFILQKHITFQNDERGLVGRQLIYFYALAIVNAGVNSLLLYTFVDGFGIFYLIGQFLASATIALYSFFVYRYLFQQ
jgi:putative flippase GtrA